MICTYRRKKMEALCRTSISKELFRQSLQSIIITAAYHSLPECKKDLRAPRSCSGSWLYTCCHRSKWRGEGNDIWPDNRFHTTDTTHITSSRAVFSAEVTVNIRIVCEKESRDLSGKCLWRYYNRDCPVKSPVFPSARKISRLFVAVAILNCRVIWHGHIARNDEERAASIAGTGHRKNDAVAKTSSRAEVNAVVTVNVRIVCEEESRAC